MPAQEGSRDLVCFSQAASVKLEQLTLQFRERLRKATIELAQQAKNPEIIDEELVELATAKVLVESVAALRNGQSDRANSGENVLGAA